MNSKMKNKVRDVVSNRKITQKESLILSLSTILAGAMLYLSSANGWAWP